MEHWLQNKFFFTTLYSWRFLIFVKQVAICGSHHNQLMYTIKRMVFCVIVINTIKKNNKLDNCKQLMIIWNYQFWLGLHWHIGSSQFLFMSINACIIRDFVYRRKKLSSDLFRFVEILLPCVACCRSYLIRCATCFPLPVSYSSSS